MSVWPINKLTFLIWPPKALLSLYVVLASMCGCQYPFFTDPHLMSYAENHHLALWASDGHGPEAKVTRATNETFTFVHAKCECVHMHI